MFDRIGAAALALGAAAAVGVPGGPAAARAPKPAPGAGVFGDTKVLRIALALPAKEYEAMQPPGGGGGFPGGPANPPAKKADPARDSDRSVFGTEFPWVRGSFAADGTTVGNVGLRYKGNSTYLAAARGAKRSFKVEFDHYDPDGRFAGLKTLNLHCGVHDPSKIRETVAYAVFRAAGVPAPRTALAEVTLTVPGRYEAELLGLYTAVEQVGKPFLRAHYGTDAGLLMKPERVRGLDHLGDDWGRYQATYQPKRDATPEEQRRVIEFTRLVNRGDDAAFNKEIASYLDVDAFLRFLAVTALVSNLDSFFTNGHNYYLYLHPETNKFHFVPWDVDLALGNFAFYGTADQQMDLSVARPYQQNRLADRVLAVREHGDRYREILKELAGTVFTRERWLKEVAALEGVTKEPLAKDAKAAAARKEGGPGGFGRPPELKTFFEKRTESVAAQLAGKSKGYAPQMAGFGPPGGFGPGNQLARPLAEALDADKDGKVSEAEFAAGMKRLFAEWDADRSGTLEQKEIADGLQKLAPAPRLGPPGGGGVIPAPKPKGP
jgi:hypothetical protein